MKKKCKCRKTKKQLMVLKEALRYAVNKYGAPGGPWNVPSDPGGWIDKATKALAGLKQT